MPNWCSNRMYFSGEPAQIAEIKRLASGAVTPFYRRATNEGIQLFLAGSAGLLQTTEDVQFERHCCKVSDEAAFCLIQRPYISKTLLTRRISPRG
ncbi:DUF1281 domain-containing protein, partial [Salmonella enterica]